MKWMKGIVVVASILAMAACGGSSDGGGTETPSATSAKTMGALTNASMWMFSGAPAIFNSIPAGAMVVKADGSYMNIQCTGTYAGFDCVIWDSLGSATSADHKCDVTGTVNEFGSVFQLAYDCVNFNPDTSVTVDGNWTADITINQAMVTSASVGKGAEKSDSSTECDIEDIPNVCGTTMTVSGGTCSVECGGTAACTEAGAAMSLIWTVGSRGVKMTDDCGTFNMAPGLTASMLLCSVTNTSFMMSYDLSGTINGEAINETINIDCTNMSLY